MKEVTIAIPSFKRSAFLLGYEYFPNAQYIIQPSQHRDYARVVKASRLIVLPHSFDGNKARIKNWILKNLPRPIIMLDVDVSAVGMVQGQPPQMQELNWAHAEEFLIEACNMADHFGCVIWGIPGKVEAKDYLPSLPFSLITTVKTPFICHMKHGLFYDERLSSREDLDICLQALNKHRKVLRFNKYFYVARKGSNNNGEEDAARILRKKWGTNIIQVTRGKVKAKIPIAGV